MNCIVFGATGGIGKALVAALRGKHSVMASGQSNAKLEALKEEYDCMIQAGDARIPEHVEAVFEKAEAAAGWASIDYLVSCVGNVLVKPLTDLSLDEWNLTFATNVTTNFNILKSAIKRMGQQENGGSIVLTSAANAFFGLPKQEAISTAKAAVAGLVRSAAATYAPKKVRINAIAPSITHTPMTEAIFNNPTLKAAAQGQHPLGILGETEDMVSAILFLLENKFMTGQIIRVDGGLTAVKPRNPMLV